MVRVWGWLEAYAACGSLAVWAGRAPDVRLERAEIRAVTIVARYGRLCTPSITIHSETAGSWKPRSKPMETIAASNSASNAASCHTTRSTWAKSAGSAHLGVRRNGLLEVSNPLHTALPTVWVSASPATDAAMAPLNPEPTLGG